MVAPNFESMGFVEFTRKALAKIAKTLGLPAQLADTDPHPCGPLTIDGIAIGQITSIEWGELDPTVGPLGDHRQNYLDN